eukprot:4829498-Pyramimonas_sp.AAC.1
MFCLLWPTGGLNVPEGCYVGPGPSARPRCPARAPRDRGPTTESGPPRLLVDGAGCLESERELPAPLSLPGKTKSYHAPPRQAT